MGIFKLFSILSVLAAIMIAAYLYVSHINGTTQPIDTSSAPNTSAGNAVNNFNEQSQKRLQDAQSQIGQ
jgi:uncharacterized protein (UPF0333 family)